MEILVDTLVTEEKLSKEDKVHLLTAWINKYSAASCNSPSQLHRKIEIVGYMMDKLKEVKDDSNSN
jgi:hypothetical protein